MKSDCIVIPRSLHCTALYCIDVLYTNYITNVGDDVGSFDCVLVGVVYGLKEGPAMEKKLEMMTA